MGAAPHARLDRCGRPCHPAVAAQRQPVGPIGGRPGFSALADRAAAGGRRRDLRQAVPRDHRDRGGDPYGGRFRLRRRGAAPRCPGGAGRFRRRCVVLRLSEEPAGRPAEDRRPVRPRCAGRSAGRGRGAQLCRRGAGGRRADRRRIRLHAGPACTAARAGCRLRPGLSRAPARTAGRPGADRGRGGAPGLTQAHGSCVSRKRPQMLGPPTASVDFLECPPTPPSAHDGSPPHHRPDRPDQRAGGPHPRIHAGHRTLVPARMDGTHADVLCLRGPAQCRLQARAGGHQPLPRRLQPPDAADAAAGRAGGHGGDREALPGGAQSAGHPRRPAAVQLLSGEPRDAGARVHPGRAERALRHAGQQRQRAHRAAHGQRRHAGGRAVGAQARPPDAQGLRPLHHPAQQRPGQRHAAAADGPA
mmetsp:Transcript_59389/g.140282  ORF Transcript_59389/g.140282 Transcript_59389/m.140282 type:complete len:417 (+) Transcript_59389:2588-3838(+)